jgi:shikimate kinase
MKSIFICGLPGCGKSSFGKKLADYLGITWFDTDQVIEEQEIFMPIPEYVGKHGWDAFRLVERGTTQKLIDDPRQKIISLGGGSLENVQVLEAVLQKHILIYMKAIPNELVQRFSQKELSKRPLLPLENGLKLEQVLTELLTQRREKYEQSHVITDLESTHNLDLFTKRVHLFTSTPRKH